MDQGMQRPQKNSRRYSPPLLSWGSSLGLGSVLLLWYFVLPEVKMNKSVLSVTICHCHWLRQQREVKGDIYLRLSRSSHVGWREVHVVAGEAFLTEVSE